MQNTYYRMEKVPMSKSLLTIDRTAIDTAIEELSLFPNTKKVSMEYRKVKSKLDERNKQLQERLVSLQDKLSKNMKEQQVYRNVDDLIYLQMTSKEIFKEMDIIESLLDELKEEYRDLKLTYVPLYQQSLLDDRQQRPNYSITDTVTAVKWELIKAIVDLSQAMKHQQGELNELYEVLNDPAVKEKYPRIEYVLNGTNVKPEYSEPFYTVISRYHIFSAIDGQIPTDIKQHEGVDINE